MVLHVDMDTKRTSAFADGVVRRLNRMKAAHAMLPRPEAAGRRIAMPERP
jgi:acyl-CoA thioester hydrolase